MRPIEVNGHAFDRFDCSLEVVVLRDIPCMLKVERAGTGHPFPGRKFIQQNAVGLKAKHKRPSRSRKSIGQAQKGHVRHKTRKHAALGLVVVETHALQTHDNAQNTFYSRAQFFLFFVFLIARLLFFFFIASASGQAPARSLPGISHSQLQYGNFPV